MYSCDKLPVMTSAPSEKEKQKKENVEIMGKLIYKFHAIQSKNISTFIVEDNLRNEGGNLSQSLKHGCHYQLT